MITFIKKNPIKIIFLGLILIKIIHMIITADLPGYCSSEPYTSVKNRYLSDEEFIKALLITQFLNQLSRREDHYGKNQPGDEEKAKAAADDYLIHHPACCKVYRESNSDIKVHSSLWDRAFWHFQTVAVTVRDEKSTEGGYAVMSMCGQYLGAY